jgi:hypothetical protein
MRVLPFLAVLAAAWAPLPAQADLYRWRDPESGSVKFSSYPPPWFGDAQPERERAVPVDVIRYQGSRDSPATQVPPTPMTRGAAGSPVAALEAQWQSITQFFAGLPSNVDFERTGAALQQHAEMYKAVSAELDRQDPSGAARRRAQAQQMGVLERLRTGPEAQLSPKPPAQR